MTRRWVAGVVLMECPFASGVLGAQSPGRNYHASRRTPCRRGTRPWTPFADGNAWLRGRAQGGQSHRRPPSTGMTGDGLPSDRSAAPLCSALGCEKLGEARSRGVTFRERSSPANGLN